MDFLEMERNYRGKMNKKIVIINSSPHQNGNTAALAEAFSKGAKEAGHEIKKFDLAKMNLHPCLGCYGCQAGKGNPCVQLDDMQQIYDVWAQADVMVLASPVYWMDFNAQFAIWRDRLFAVSVLKPKRKEAVLLAAAASPEKEIYPIFTQYYDYLLGVFQATDKGRIVAGGCAMPGDIQNTDYLDRAYQLGKNI